jgi:hypothetical protein
VGTRLIKIKWALSGKHKKRETRRGGDTAGNMMARVSTNTIALSTGTALGAETATKPAR